MSGKWVRARYVAELHEIAARYAERGIIGTPENQTGGSGSFTPWRTAQWIALYCPPMVVIVPDVSY
jgi:hypothetical protein